MIVQNQPRHCEERSDAAIQRGRPFVGAMDWRAALAMTADEGVVA